MSHAIQWGLYPPVYCRGIYLGGVRTKEWLWAGFALRQSHRYPGWSQAGATTWTTFYLRKEAKASWIYPGWFDESVHKCHLFGDDLPWFLCAWCLPDPGTIGKDDSPAYRNIPSHDLWGWVVGPHLALHTLVVPYHSTGPLKLWHPLFDSIWFELLCNMCRFRFADRSCQRPWYFQHNTCPDYLSSQSETFQFHL